MMPNNIRFMLFPMEGNLLKIHRQNEKRNGRRVIEAIHICLLTVDGYFRFLEEHIGRAVARDLELDYSVYLGRR